MKRCFASVKVLCICLVVIVLSTSVCFSNGFTDYLRDRGYDLLDVLKIKICAPYEAKALGAHLRVTCVAQLGLVYFQGEQIGFDRRAAGVWVERRLAGGFGPFYYTSVQSDVIYGNLFIYPDTDWAREYERGIVRNGAYWDDGRHHPFSFGAEVQTGILPGIELGFYPLEVTDFLLGLLTLDPQRDDFTRIERQIEQLAELDIETLLRESEDVEMEFEEMEFEDIEEETILGDEPAIELGEIVPIEPLPEPEPEMEPEVLTEPQSLQE